MKRLSKVFMTGALAALAVPAAAGNVSGPVFDSGANTITLAQREAISEYKAYRDDMMDESTMDMLDSNNDGMITRKEFRHFYDAVFDTMDKNKDDKIMEDERPAQASANGNG